jgi:glycerol-3-phosphate dehydrogenase
MTFEELASGPPLDLVVIGGGINGCAIAEEASARGLRTALFEASDFGFGTTWRSTKLIHGGLRYLEHGDVRLVFESLRERAWLLKTRDYLVKPQRFVLPMLPWTRRPAWQLGIGLSAYDLLALYRGVPGHRKLSDEKLHELVPALPDDTSGGFTFYDARVIAPERLCLELALAAEQHGAFISNHAPVRHIGVSNGRVSSVDVEHDGQTFRVPARHVINAAGPWVDAVNELGDLPVPEMIGATRGTHIVVQLGERPGRDAVFSTAREDGRVFFSVPQGDLLLIGTTDDRYEGPPSAVRPTAEDVEYLLREARTLLPGLDITRERIRYAYAGLRPLQRARGGPEASISRRHSVVSHGKSGGAAGMYSVVGGKLSTFRPLAREAVEMLHPQEPRRVPEEPEAGDWRRALRESGAPIEVQRHLRVYGPATRYVAAAGLEVICEHSHAVAGEVAYACVSEHVETLADIMMRRTGISWGSCRGLCCYEAVARQAGGILGWSEAERERQIAAFESELDYNLPTEESLGPSLVTTLEGPE